MATINNLLRRTITLDGTWRLQRGGLTPPTTRAEGQAPVPGLVDMATGVNGSGNHWWYEREFLLDLPDSQVALLNVSRAMYGSAVYVNGQKVGEFWPSYTPTSYDVRRFLKFGAANTLAIRVGQYEDLPKTVLSGFDFEKATYTPGLFDSVSLVLSGYPRIDTVLTNPRLDGTVDVRVRLSNDGAAGYEGNVELSVRRANDGVEVATASREETLASGTARDVNVSIKIPDCHFWSPEDPFLYTLTTRTAGDERTDRFGMRTFGFAAAPPRLPLLNGKVYPMHGTNICIFRFAEDPNRGSLIWDRDWVRQLIRRFKSMHWNCMRICIGSPPAFWYDLIDEEGLLVQDEFPIWFGYKPNDDLLPEEITADEIVAEVTPWVYEHANHPSVCIWDLSNETSSAKTWAALPALRNIDPQGRLWENGTFDYNPGAYVPGEPVENHPYPFSNPRETPTYFNSKAAPWPLPNPQIVNEYGWLWLARDGSPTRLTYKNYEHLLGGGIGSGDYGTEEERRYMYSLLMAANTEWLRASRQVSILEHFCGLSSSRPVPEAPEMSGQTSDNFLEPVSELKFDPYFESYVRDAFAPVGLCIHHYDAQYDAGTTRTFSVVVSNDTDRLWAGTIKLMVVAGGPAVSKKSARVIVPPVSAQCSAEPGQQVRCEVAISLPSQQGDYSLVAEYGEGDDNVQSVRDFVVGKRPRWSRLSKQNLAAGCPVTASSDIAPGYEAALVVDGKDATRWSSDYLDNQWVQVDLGAQHKISGVEIYWEAAAGKDYDIEVSNNGDDWTCVRSIVDNTATGVVEHSGLNAAGQYVRLNLKTRQTPYGFSIYELQVLGE